MKKDSNKGLSLIEILIVVGLTAIISGTGLLVFRQIKRREELFSVVSQIVQIIDSARAKAVVNKNDETWKVVFQPDQVNLQGSRSGSAESYRLPEGYLLSATITEVIFNPIEGTVPVCLTGCLSEVQESPGNLNHQFRVLFSGAVEY